MNDSRRNFLKLSALAGVGLAGNLPPAAAITGRGTPERPGGKTIDLQIAGYPYEHVRALIDGAVPVEGCNTSFRQGKIGALNTNVFSGPQTLAVTEIGLSPFMHAYANDEFRDYSLVPVFPLRLFRHKSVFVHADRGIRRPEDLKGRRVGTPGYSSTSLTWIRGFLKHDYGVDPSDMEWVVSATDSSAKDAGKVSRQENVLPDGTSVRVGPDGKDESDLLLDGDVDALLHGIEPRAFVEGHPKVKRLFEDPRAVERDYFARTGLFPIMHAVAIRNDLIDANPWLPEAVCNAYSQAKQRRYEAMRMGWVMETLPWFGQEFDETRKLMGDNFWPYGIEANKTSLNALFQYSHEQGLARRRLTIEELFHPSTLEFTEP
jgi:4,5-dihydroxyphthalate decarboxylase